VLVSIFLGFSRTVRVGSFVSPSFPGTWPRHAVPRRIHGGVF
jgi:hypothetical protein